MKGIVGILMVIAVMYPPALDARRIYIVDPATTANTSSAAAAAPAAKKPQKEKTAKPKKEKKKKKNKKGAKSTLPEGAVATANQLATRLGALSPFAATVSYDVQMPMGADEIDYSVEILSTKPAGGADPLSPADYLIDWTLDHNGNTTQGFLAYFDGNHYRYRDHRLQEFHYATDPEPFRSRDGGVQSTGQFVDLIPQQLSSRIESMLSNPDFKTHFNPDTIYNNSPAGTFEAVQLIAGEVGMRYRLIADQLTAAPQYIRIDFNPGRISEQTITAKFVNSDSATSTSTIVPYSEASLEERYPEVFEKYRDNGYRIEHIRSLPLPAFSLPAANGTGRVTHEKGEHMGTPTVLAIVDYDMASTPATIKALRQAALSASPSPHLILAFTGNNADNIAAATTGEASQNEEVLMSATSLARSVGTAVFPTILIVNSSGIVANVFVGENHNLASDVIQSIGMIY